MSYFAIASVSFLLLAALLVHRFQRDYYVTQYLFFLRYPLLAGMLLLFLPWFGPMLAPDSLTNIFVLGPVGSGFAAFGATLLAWVVVFTGRLIGVSCAERNKLRWREAHQRQSEEREALQRVRKLESAGGLPGAASRILKPMADEESRFPPVPQNLLCGPWLASPVLAISLVAKVSSGGGSRWNSNLIGCLIGMAIASAPPLILAFVRRRRAGNSGSTPSSSPRRADDPSTFSLWVRGRQGAQRKGLHVWARLVDLIALPFAATADLEPDLRRLHLRALKYSAFTLFVYFAIGAFTWPGFAQMNSGFPALAFLMLLLMLATWILGSLSFQFDRSRMPGIAIIVVLILLWHAFWPSGHTYRVEDWGGKQPPISATEYLTGWTDDRREAWNTDEPPLVLVAASGGGITAALWTAWVLTQLEEAVPGFGEHVAVLSSVSGGGLGGMLYVDAFEDGTVTKEARGALIADAGASSLSAATWGIAYLDLPRIGLGSKVLGPFDRGWALERRWKHFLSDPNVTLGEWTDDVYAFRRPLQVFNITLQETGERLLLSGVSFNGNRTDPESQEQEKNTARDLVKSTFQAITSELQEQQRGHRRRRDLFSMAGSHADIQVVTAARMSATFPYLSPQAKPTVAKEYESNAFHGADGGYYDNSGMVTLLEVLEDYLAAEGKRPTRRIALIEIRASGPSDSQPDAEPKRGGLLNSMFGPIATLYNVRTASQVGRNAFEVRIARDLWRTRFGVDLRHFTFHLSENQPLSWHLTETEKDRIKGHWPSEEDLAMASRLDPRHARKGPPQSGRGASEAREDNAHQVFQLREFLQREGERGPRLLARMK